MELRCRMDNKDDIEELSKLLSPYGIYIETDIFGKTYIMIDRNILNRCRPRNSSRNKAPDPATIEKIKSLRTNHVTIREIAKVTGYSTGMICKILNTQKTEK